jgi:hypothetical protein
MWWSQIQRKGPGIALGTGDSLRHSWSPLQQAWPPLELVAARQLQGLWAARQLVDDLFIGNSPSGGCSVLLLAT